jgi:hypothetical protein
MPYKSKIEEKGLTSKLGNVPDADIAKETGLSCEAVRAFRVRRRIPARWMGQSAVVHTKVPPLTALRRSKGKFSKSVKLVSNITTAEDADGRTTNNGNVAANIITVHTPSQVARTRSRSKVTLTIATSDDSVITLTGRAVHTLFRVLSAHYGRPLPRNGWDE